MIGPGIIAPISPFINLNYQILYSTLICTARKVSLFVAPTSESPKLVGVSDYNFNRSNNKTKIIGNTHNLADSVVGGTHPYPMNNFLIGLVLVIINSAKRIITWGGVEEYSNAASKRKLPLLPQIP